MAARKHKPVSRGKRAAANRPRSDARGSIVRMLVLTLSAVGIALLVYAPSAVIVYAVGMAPTAVAIFIDRDPQRNASISVASLNFAGVSPYLAEFVFGNATFGRALELVSDVFALAIIYGSAAAGWVLILALPPLVVVVLGVVSDSQLQTLRKEQQKLIDEWGEGVANP